jgi:voltage-gated potassium channel Kch
MRAPATNYTVTCWPGRHGTSFGQEIRPGQVGLVIRFDPVDMVITQAPFPTGAADFVRWCRQLSRAAGQVASEVENAAAMPRHYADENNEQGHGAEGGEQSWS